MTDFCLPDFGMLLGLQEPNPNVATQDDNVTPSLEYNAPCVEYGEVTVAFNELPTQIQDFDELTSSASSNGSDRVQQLHAGLAFGVTPNGEYAGAAPFLPVPIDAMVAADHVLLKSEYDMHHYGGDCCWSPDPFTPHSYVNQLSRRWSSPSPSYPSASETYAMQCAGFDDCGCAPNRTSPFMVGDVVSCEPFHVRSHPTDLQFVGSQQALADMCEVVDPTRTVQTNHPASCYKPFSHVRAKSTSFTDDLLRCTSMEDDLLSTTSQTEEMDEFSDEASAAGLLQRRRASNKTAAKKSRQRKRETAQRYKKEWLETECDNTRLQYEISQLRKRVVELQCVLRDHKCKRHQPTGTTQQTGQSVSSVGGRRW